MKEYSEDEEFEDDSIYGEETREDLVDGDALSPEEEGFMKGYEEADAEAEKEMKELDDDEDI